MQRPTLSDKAHAVIKERLLALEKGSHISVRKTAAEIGMSYTPVREAFQRLEREGLLELVPGVGFFVARLSMRDIIEIYQVRECLEHFVLDRVFDLITEKDMETLAEYVRLQAAFLEQGDVTQYVKTDERFHLVFFELYGNRHFTRLIKNVRERYLICSVRIARNRSGEGVAEHLELLSHIKNHDRQKALEVMGRHLENSMRRMREGFISILDL